MASGEGESDVKTLFLAGLPDDVKEREIYNLFRPHSGYQSCQLKYTGRGSQIVAFVCFSDHASAVAAKEALNGHKFDPQTGETLHVELARANSRSKRSRPGDRVPSSIDKKYRGHQDIPGGYGDLGVGGNLHIPGMVNSVYNDLNGFPPSQSAGLMPPYAVQDSMHGLMMGQTVAGSQTAVNGNPPCSTLFFGNLGPNCTEEELLQVLLRFPGLVKIKMQTRAGLPVAFVEFQDVLYSTEALGKLQNMMLPSSDNGGIRVEYAKSRMGLPGRERHGRA
ncbi:hypothetical protein O6H91_09G063300 [Diphasiastrum complanatum]|uniref:Uncharacterized protein n=1 Tax=Diphasiastrum complanatum TaxID=34168 RepID=A0ACC2CPT3_DIPCM|nr:hypothetical protein O6H91_09G063300 [Diphasiastrum complanatum]